MNVSIDGAILQCINLSQMTRRHNSDAKRDRCPRMNQSSTGRKGLACVRFTDQGKGVTFSLYLL